MRFFKKKTNRSEATPSRSDLAAKLAQDGTPLKAPVSKPNYEEKWQQLAAEVEANERKAAAERAASETAATEILELDTETETEAETETSADTQPEPELADSVIMDSGFLTQATTDFREPSFTAAITPKADRIDVTPPTYQEPVIETAPTDPYDAASQQAASSETPSISDYELEMPTAYTRERGADLNSMRLDVARISADIQSGEELYRRAQKRIENLTDFVEAAEVDFSLLNRLEPENRRLKARNRTLEADLDDKIRKLKTLEIEVKDHRDRLTERNSHFDELQSNLALAKNSLREYERTLKAARENADRNALAAERAETALSVEKRENEVMRQKLVEVSVSYEEKQSVYVEAKKMADSLAQDASDFRASATRASAENVDLRNALDASQRANNQMKAEMVSLHEDIRNFKTQYEFNLISREDEITALQAQLDTLQKQLDIKDEIVRNAAHDVTELRKVRTTQDLERERLESLIQTQTYQLEKAQTELLQTKQDVTDFDRRYRDVAAALTVAQTLRQSSAPAEQPDIQPAPQAPVRNQPLTADIGSQDSFEALTDDEIMDQVTDFKLGLRDDVV